MRCLTWNILAPVFVRLPDSPHTAFAYCSDDDLDEHRRRERIVTLMDKLQPDIVCLQEVQMEPTGDPEKPFGVPSWLQRKGFLNLVPQGKAQTPKEWQQTLEHNRNVLGRPFVTHVATLINLDRVEVLGTFCTSNSLLVHVRDKISGDTVVIGNCHLSASPGATSEARLKQLGSAGKSAAKLDKFIVLCGDLNDSKLSLPGFGEVESQKPSWTNGKEKTRADHVLVSENLHSTLQVVWDGSGNIPNAEIPSDHSPILALISKK